MHKFLFGYLLTCLSIFAWNYPSHFPGSLSWGRLANLFVLIVLAPSCVTALALILKNYRHPRQLLMPGRRGWFSTMLFASVTAIIGLSLSAVVATLTERYVSEFVMIPACCLLTSALALSILPRVRPGLCRQCDYDLRESLAFGRCPECGTQC